jgi:hypothetical protein
MNVPSSRYVRRSKNRNPFLHTMYLYFPQMFVHRHNCRWRLDLSMFGLLYVSGYAASAVKGTRFPFCG